MKNVSGKLVIISVMAVALAGAGASWWFRYSATHRAAKFWGPETTVLIRDAPLVELIELSRAKDKDINGTWPNAVMLNDESWIVLRRRDASHARGLVHLRHALLEDRSYIWPSRREMPSAAWRWGLRYSLPASPSFASQRTIWFTSDCRLMMRDQRGDEPDRILSSEPIANGLATMFAELSKEVPPAR